MYRGSNLVIPSRSAFAGKAQTVTEAVLTRYSCRDFTQDAVDGDLLRELLVKAARAASGGNLQPWKVYVLEGDDKEKFCSEMRKHVGKTTPGYRIYPKDADLGPKYVERRGTLAEDMFSLVGIARNERMKRLQYVSRNFAFFGAPTGLIVTIPRSMGPPQWQDLGHFLATFNLLCREQGLHTCNQEAWANVSAPAEKMLGIQPEDMLFCGVAVGYAKHDSSVNQLRAARAKPDEFIFSAKL
eukprot:TRINITY_DN22334_c0_g1_i1.p1 TRINITY_DN22334_c0_g1~~TRINITY_DN22334_c0_g1_i1.p1  ORF type:complete len:241 (+),score=49.69 TRINITY_DN22334_c0_g1_i1:61-783(+)